MLVTTVSCIAVHLQSNRADAARIDPLIAALKGAGDFSVGGGMVRARIVFWSDCGMLNTLAPSMHTST